MKYKVREINCTSIINKSGILDYCINPYVGCTNACVYCYADFMLRYRKIKEPWGSFADIKVNALEILKKQIKNLKKGRVFISSVTDPYQEIEEKYKLTRSLLKILLENQFPITIQTKSSLIERDIDLIKQFKDIEVGFTIHLDDNLAEIFEPNASKPSKRIETLKKLKENGIKTYVFIGPILPFISNPLDIINKTYNYVDYYFVDKLNIKQNTWHKINKILEEYDKTLLPKYKEIFFGDNNYYDKIKKEIKDLLNKKNKEYIFCY